MTINNKGRIQCDSCGCFISIKDLDEGTASHCLSTPDSEYTDEEYESLCFKCNKPDEWVIKLERL